MAEGVVGVFEEIQVEGNHAQRTFLTNGQRRQARRGLLKRAAAERVGERILLRTHAQMKLVHDHVRQVGHDVELICIEDARLHVDEAQGADVVAFSRLQREGGIETNARVRQDVRISCEPRVLRCVRDDDR
jgi:hypothetical protein